MIRRNRVTPAKAGVQAGHFCLILNYVKTSVRRVWIPACAGMTNFLRGLRGQEGQTVLMIVVAVLLIATALVPLLVRYAQNEAKWSVKQSQDTDALSLAEAGIDKAVYELSIATANWQNVLNGQALPGFNFDTAYADIPGGTYAVSIASGPQKEEATVISIGRDSLKRERRAIKAVYENSTFSNTAIRSDGGIDMGSGHLSVEWGALLSPNAINIGSDLHPSFWSGAGILPYAPNPPPASDANNCWWHSYYSDLPPPPAIDFATYESSAQAETGCPSGGTGCTPPGNTTCCYYVGSQSWSNFTDTTGKSYYINGDLTVKSIYIVGSVIVTGNLQTSNGLFGTGTPSMSVPQNAWQQYCNDWGFYTSNFDASAPATYAQAVAAGYQSGAGLTYGGNKVAFNGFVYVGGGFQTGNGGGNSEIYGGFYVIGGSTLTSNSNVTIYYNQQANENLLLTKIYLTRASWQEIVEAWPGGLP